jgi:BstXI restriction endonuclease
MPTSPKNPKLPQLLDRKIYKTGQTRGADDDVIYQNRVSRSSTVLIPYSLWDGCSRPPAGENQFQNGFIALVSPADYFGTPNIARKLSRKGLRLGGNALVFYETRADWNANNPDLLGWVPAASRSDPLGGNYVARIPATTAADNGDKIIRGFSTTAGKGAGIRLYEYASEAQVARCRLQLEAIFWLCGDAVPVALANGMTTDNIEIRRAYLFDQCKKQALLDFERLHVARILNATRRTICPLCLEELSGNGFFNRLQQAQGREVPDLTVTQLNLFHIEELQYGAYNHAPYNLGWGHHHCNVVVKDSGIIETLGWMHTVVRRNIKDGHFTPENNLS